MRAGTPFVALTMAVCQHDYARIQRGSLWGFCRVYSILRAAGSKDPGYLVSSPLPLYTSHRTGHYLCRPRVALWLGRSFPPVLLLLLASPAFSVRRRVHFSLLFTVTPQEGQSRVVTDPFPVEYEPKSQFFHSPAFHAPHLKIQRSFVWSQSKLPACPGKAWEPGMGMGVE